MRPRVGQSTRPRIRPRGQSAVEGEGEREKVTYARPVQEENALMESEAFSNALKGGFSAFALVCVAFLLKLSQPVIGEMIDAFPKGGR